MSEPELVPRRRGGGALWLVAIVVATVVLGVGALAAFHLTRLPVEPRGSLPLTAPVASPEPAATPAPAPASTRVRVDPAWAERIAARTGIPVRALEAYALADLLVDAEDPACGIGWNTLAGIGAVESDHGRHGGSSIGADGYAVPAIRGPALNGDGVAAIPDTDGGRWDADTTWDRAVGPLQFIPDTWVRWGADGDGDGVADPNQIDDAALAAARYLCASGPMTGVDGWRAAIFSYNHLDTYVDAVAAAANRYAAAAG
jgi:membrane-bound lytic murein transglycosylase B